ncbi:MAG: N-acetyl-gamma-glutamyl-phosphate reductase [Bacteroidota bacterium]|nr:N-acetyl-gamma-glutamyl-phosphate reductase [Bacteroidota bacterium]
MGIIGGSGMAAGELLRLLEGHDRVQLRSVVSRSHTGQCLGEVHDGLGELAGHRFAEAPVDDVDVLFLALPHGESAPLIAALDISPGTTVIDLGSDHRLRTPEQGFIYGLTEAARPLLREARASGQHVANPGCFATALQLGLLPLLHAGLLRGDVHSSAVTGSTGAGSAMLPTTHFSWRQGNMQVYKAFRHQHLAEIRATIDRYAGNDAGHHFFVPYRGPFTRGIIATSYTAFEGNASEAEALFREQYAAEEFVRYSAEQPALKQVVNTNRCLVSTEVIDGMCIVTTVLDNLLKGAAGQAVQNMNLLFGFEEGQGLRLKASVY